MFIGARFLLVPGPAAAGYGVPAKADGDAAAYLSIRGVRDGSFGILGLVLLAFADAGAAGWFMLVVALCPLARPAPGAANHDLRDARPAARAAACHIAVPVSAGATAPSTALRVVSIAGEVPIPATMSTRPDPKP